MLVNFGAEILFKDWQDRTSSRGRKRNVKCLMGTGKAEQPRNISVMLSLYTFLLQKMYLMYGSMYIISCCNFFSLVQFYPACQASLQNLSLFNVQDTRW